MGEEIGFTMDKDTYIELCEKALSVVAHVKNKGYYSFFEEVKQLNNGLFTNHLLFYFQELLDNATFVLIPEELKTAVLLKYPDYRAWIPLINETTVLIHSAYFEYLGCKEGLDWGIYLMKSGEQKLVEKLRDEYGNLEYAFDCLNVSLQVASCLTINSGLEKIVSSEYPNWMEIVQHVDLIWHMLAQDYVSKHYENEITTHKVKQTKKSRKEKYKEYLQTDHWKTTRKAALERAGHRCQVCATTERLDVHHNTYENLGNEKPEDLVVLCRTHHEMFHKK